MGKGSPHPKRRHALRSLQVAAGAAAVVGVLAGGCRDEPEPAAEPAALGRRAKTEEAPGETAVRAYPARRCGECHEPATRTWEASAHARSDTSPVYLAMREASGRTDCDRCHAPLRAIVKDDARVVAEGVTCDVCHTIKAVEPDAKGTELALDVAGATRYGPLCNLEDHYFHKMGCSPLHARSEMCGGCHLWTTHTPAMKELDVLTTYAEWRDGPYAEVEQPCQGCHMPAIEGAVAVGWDTEARASDHGMFGDGDELRRRAIGLELKVDAEGNMLSVDLDVINKGGGHSLPAGLPGRRIVARASALGADGKERAHEERTYAKVLVDESGEEVPFYAAARVQSDTRLAADERRHEQFSLPAEGVVEVRVEVFAHALSATVAESLGVAAPPPVRLAGVRALREQRGDWEVLTQ